MTVEFDEDTLRRMTAYCGGDPRIQREVVDGAFSEYGYTEWSLPDFLSDIAEAVAKIPETAREAATVELGGGDDESVHLTISFRRLETDDEVCKRVERAYAAARSQQERERAEYLRLKAKYDEK